MSQYNDVPFVVPVGGPVKVLKLDSGKDEEGAYTKLIFVFLDGFEVTMKVYDWERYSPNTRLIMFRVPNADLDQNVPLDAQGDSEQDGAEINLYIYPD